MDTSNPNSEKPILIIDSLNAVYLIKKNPLVIYHKLLINLPLFLFLTFQPERQALGIQVNITF